MLEGLLLVVVSSTLLAIMNYVEKKGYVNVESEESLGSSFLFFFSRNLHIIL